MCRRLWIKEKVAFFYNIHTKEQIISILWRFKEYILMFFSSNNHNTIFQKGDIYIIDFWYNIWGELNKKRPGIITSDNRLNRWDCVVALPLKTHKTNKKQDFSVIITNNISNQLETNSYTNITDIRCISKKRISKYIGKLTTQQMEEVDKKMIKVFQLQKEKDTQ